MFNTIRSNILACREWLFFKYGTASDRATVKRQKQKAVIERETEALERAKHIQLGRWLTSPKGMLIAAVLIGITNKTKRNRHGSNKTRRFH